MNSLRRDTVSCDWRYEWEYGFQPEKTQGVRKKDYIRELKLLFYAYFNSPLSRLHMHKHTHTQPLGRWIIYDTCVWSDLSKGKTHPISSLTFSSCHGAKPNAATQLIALLYLSAHCLPLSLWCYRNGCFVLLSIPPSLPLFYPSLYNLSALYPYLSLSSPLPSPSLLACETAVQQSHPLWLDLSKKKICAHITSMKTRRERIWEFCVLSQPSQLRPL